MQHDVEGHHARSLNLGDDLLGFLVLRALGPAHVALFVWSLSFGHGVPRLFSTILIRREAPPVPAVIIQIAVILLALLI